MNSDVPVRAWLIPLLVAALCWGSSFLFIEWALEAFSPAQVGFGRLVVGAAVLIALVTVMRQWARLTARQVVAVAVTGAFMSGIPLVLIPMAQQDITSILASLLNATTPLWTALFVGLLLPQERPRPAQLLGVGIGALGIAVLVGAWNVREFPLRGVLLMLGGTACYGIGSALSRRLTSSIAVPTAVLTTVQVSASAVMLAPFAFASAAPAAGAYALTGTAAWGILGLGVLGTSVGYLMFWRVIATAGPTIASSVTYMAPVIAVVLGALVLGESITWNEPVGAVVVFAGVWLASRARRPVREA